MKNRILVLFLAFCLAFTCLVGCAGNETKNKEGGNKQTEDKEGSKKGEDVLVGLATDEGGLNDKSFNQSADTGVKKAQDEFGVKYSAIESESKEDYEENLSSLVDEGANIVIGVGFQMNDAVTSVAENNKDNKFLIVDSVVDLDNVQSVTFKEHEGSFLMGVMAGKMTKTNKIGFIGGKDFDLINRFEVGFAAGVMSVNEEAGKGLMDRTTVKYADSFGDVNKGYEIAKALYDEGCDIIYHAAGGVGIGMFSAADEIKKAGKDVWAIGVDMDQAETVPKYKDIILSSMMKRVDIGTYNAVKDIVEENFEGGKTIQLGLKEDGVGIAPSTKDKAPAEVIELADKYKKAIVDEKIVVPKTLDELKDFEIPTLE